VTLSGNRLFFNLAFEVFADVVQHPSGSTLKKLYAAMNFTRFCANFAGFVESYDIVLLAHKYVLNTIPLFIWFG
jgi:hypothetical protein